MLHKPVSENDAWGCVSFWVNLSCFLNHSLLFNIVAFFTALLTDLVFGSLPLSVCARMRMSRSVCLLVSGPVQENVFGAVFCSEHMGDSYGVAGKCSGRK